MTCERSNELMVDALYNDLPTEEKKEFDNHIASCTSCALSLEKMKATLNLMDKRLRAEPDESYWKSYWNTLSDKLDTHTAAASHIVPFAETSPKRREYIPSWAFGIAATLLIAVGVYLGKTYFGGRGMIEIHHESAVAQQELPNDTVNTQALAYLERSKNLLLGMVNIDEEHLSSINLERQQQISRQLIQKAYYLKAALSDPEQQRMRQLIGDLEVILLELANVEVKPGVPAIELVKKGVNQKSILLKINLEEMRAAVKKPTPKKIVKPNL